VKLPFKGSLDSAGLATIQVPRKNGQSALTLTLEYASAGNLLRGTLSDGTKTASFDVERSAYSAAVPFSTEENFFTARLPGMRGAEGDVPKGDGFLSILVGKTPQRPRYRLTRGRHYCPCGVACSWEEATIALLATSLSTCRSTKARVA
jgi:hypothetical protein